jgi:hypothetical protein
VDLKEIGRDSVDWTRVSSEQSNELSALVKVA